MTITHPQPVGIATRATPSWFADAKLGIAVHWGLYSVPGFAESPELDFTAFMRELTAGKDTHGRLPYAEFYLNSLRIPGSRTARHHAATYGGASYFDFQDAFERSAAQVDFTEWAELFVRAGARYVVMTSKHLDGFPLWPTHVVNPGMPRDYRSRRDLIGAASDAVRAAGMRMGLYYSGGVDWTFSKFPVRTMTDLMRQQAQGPQYAAYATAQWRELIDTYRPSLLWNDMGWPAESDPHELFAHYYDSVPDGVVNDRWTQVTLPHNRLARAAYLRFALTALKAMARTGRPLPARPPTFQSDYETHEYALPAEPPARPWELIRGLGKSFGYSAADTASDTLSGEELIALLVDVVARGGNLLINVGPDGTGRIPDLQSRPLDDLGAWLDKYGEAIHGTRTWIRPSAVTRTGDQVHFTRRGNTVYAIVFTRQPSDGLTIRMPAPPAAARIGWLGGTRELSWTPTDDGVRISVPESLPPAPAHVLAITGAG
jgi:alpha-L-fucosidase